MASSEGKAAPGQRCRRETATLARGTPARPKARTARGPLAPPASGNRRCPRLWRRPSPPAPWGSPSARPLWRGSAAPARSRAPPRSGRTRL
eukprot:9893920-Alexandrium_andersonii.AAC.1